MDILTLRSGMKKTSLLLALLVFSSITLAEGIKINWIEPELNKDGTTIQEIEKYNLYYTLNNVLQDTIEIDALSNTYTIQNIKTGTHIIQMSTVAGGLEGDLSDPLIISTTTSKPVKIMLTIELIEVK